MADPLFYEFIGVPSEESERSRAIISSPAPTSSHRGYYDSFLSRRRGQPEPNFARRAYNMKDWQRSQAQADYEQEAQAALQRLTSLDPGDPSVQQKQEQVLFNSRYGQNLVRDPRVVSTLKNTLAESTALQKHFESDPDSRADYIMGRREGLDHRSALAKTLSSTENRKNRLWFVEKGGNLDEFDKFAPDGRFDRAAAQQYINSLPSKKDANKPWQERLSFKEGEAIRDMARGARALEDFEKEYTDLLADKKGDPTFTRDVYVKEYKNAQNFDAYRQKRLMETGDQLMRDYGLTREEAANVLGMQAGAQATSPQSDPWADRTTYGPLPMTTSTIPSGPSNSSAWADRTTYGDGTSPSIAPIAPGAPVAPQPTVSQADLKRIDGAAAPVEAAAPVSFESLSQQIVQRAADQRKAREDEYLSRQKTKEAAQVEDNTLWEGAKTKLLQGLTPELTATLSPSPTEDQLNQIFQRAGIDASKPAFVYPTKNGIPGREVGWYEVLTQGLAQDPRIKKLQEGGVQTAAPSRTSLSHLWEDMKGAVTGK
jgi:hypothetical protein